MAAAGSYRAEMIGVSERDRMLLRSLLAATQARTGMIWDGGANLPCIHFVDLDSPQGAEFWQTLSTNERRGAAIAIAQSAPADRSSAWLPKPLRSGSLITALEKISTPAAVPAAAAPVPAPASARAATAAPVASGPLRLLDILDSASNATTQAIKSAHWPDLVLLAGGRQLMRTAPLEHYEHGFAVSLELANVAKYTGGPLPDENSLDPDTVRWLALLHAPLTELAPRLHAYAAVRLSALPDFGALPHTLAHVRMAAWLTQHAASPQELAEMIGVADEDVQRFLGACEAIGLLQEVVQTPDAAIAAAAEIAPPSVAEIAPASSATTRNTPSIAGDTRSVLERLRAARAQG